MQNLVNSIDRQLLDGLLNEVLAEDGCNMLIPDIEGKEIILYGAGNLGVLAVDLLRQAGITPKYIVDKGSSKWGQKIDGIVIVSPDDISAEDKENAVFSICIVNFPIIEIIEYLREFGCKYIIPFYDLTEYYYEDIKISNGWFCRKLSEEDKKEIRRIYENLADEISRAHYIQVLNWRIRRQEVLFRDAKVVIEDKFFPPEIMRILTKDEFFVDCGAYNGNTIKRFLENTGECFKEIAAFEPDRENFQQLSSFISTLNENIRERIYAYPLALGSHDGDRIFLEGRGMAGRFYDIPQGTKLQVVSLDRFLENKPISFLKVHVEGAEYDVLLGAVQVIRKNRPVIVVTLYHSEEGLWKVPKLLIETLEGYSFYHRLHGYCGIESVIYAIPQERLL